MSKQVITSTPKLFIGLDIHKKSWKFHFMMDIMLESGHYFPFKSDVVLNSVKRLILGAKLVSPMKLLAVPITRRKIDVHKKRELIKS